MNDADRPALRPVLRPILGGRAVNAHAAWTSQIGRFETETLALNENREALADLNGPTERNWQGSSASCSENTAVSTEHDGFGGCTTQGPQPAGPQTSSLAAKNACPEGKIR